MDLPSHPMVQYDKLRAIVDLNEVDAYVHIGDGTDDLLRYLTRVDNEDNLAAFVMTPTETAVCLRPRFVAEAERTFPGDRIIENDTEIPIVETVEDILGDDAEIRIPETTAVGLARRLESVASVEVIAEPDTVWCTKSHEEHQIARHIAAGVQQGMARAETILAEAEPTNGSIVWNGSPLTTDSLRREIKKELADVGLTDMGNVIVGAGPSCAELHFTGKDSIRPQETVLIDLGPRGPFGYHGDMSRTFVPGEPPEWERRAFDIVQEALEAAFELLEDGAGTAASDLYAEMADVIESYGYGTGLHESRDDTVGLYHGTGHGLGVRIHEKPFQSRDSEMDLEAGTVITVEPGLYDSDRGGVRLEDVVIVREDGYENLMSYPYEIEPTTRAASDRFVE